MIYIVHLYEHYGDSCSLCGVLPRFVECISSNASHPPDDNVRWIYVRSESALNVEKTGCYKFEYALGVDFVYVRCSHQHLLPVLEVMES